MQGAPVKRSEAGTSAHEQFSFSLGTTMLLLTLASVVFGVVAINPGLGIWVCVLSVPVLVRTIRNVRESEAQGNEVSSLQKVGLFLSSFVAASVLAVLGCVAAFASFCGVCLLLVSAGDDSGALVWGFGLTAFGALCLFAIIRHFVVRRRERA